MSYNAPSGYTLGWNCKGCRCSKNHWTHPHGTDTDWERLFNNLILGAGGATNGHATWTRYAQEASGTSDTIRICQWFCASIITVWWIHFLGVFTKLQKATVSLIMSIFLSASDNLAPTKRISMKFDVWIFFFKICQENSSFINIQQEWWVLYVKTNIHFLSYLVQFIEWEMFHTKLVEKIKTYILSPRTFSANCTLYEIMWRNIVELCRP